ncbi:MAG: toxin co-regulated pilus biosynthesis Q family protein [Alphaproteobacteria bacterium]|nr:toxin co-regulated pilus biosynthesis Q family protein [Alphaproteobacteria bacterium]
MKKSLLLSFCLLCVSGVCAYANTQANPSSKNSTPYVKDDASIIDATTQRSRCGINGISCNDTASINYTKTEADFRRYGERTKRAHLYTQSGVGNNVSAAIRPSVENDIVVSSATKSPTKQEAKSIPVIEEDIFSETPSLILDTPRKPLEGEVGRADNVETITEKKIKEAAQAQTTSPQKSKARIISRTEEIIEPKDNAVPTTKKTTKKTIIKTVTEEGTTYEIECSTPSCTEVQRIKQIVNTKPHNESKYANVNTNTTEYEIVCEDECEEFLASNDIINFDALIDDDDTITSEFSEDAFDIADFIEEDEDTDVVFNDIGAKEKVVADLDIEEVKINDETVLTWEAEEGDNLRELLTKWSAMSGWKLLWNTNRNYVLSAGVMFKGKFADVSSALIRAFARARPAPIATYYKGNRVIVVETMENENAY